MPLRAPARADPRPNAETGPARYLSPGTAPALLVLETPFPPDDRSAGFERGTSVSKAWDQAATDAAIEAADHVGGRLQELAKAPEATAELQQDFHFYVWDEHTGEVRWMCAWDTAEADVDAFAAAIVRVTAA